jgi:hypothetical protein
MSVFIAPQSTSVVAGDAWGLVSTFNCTIVSDISQFTLLSQRNSDGSAPRCPPITFNSSDATPEHMGLPNLCDFDVYTLHPISNATLVDLNVLDSAFFPVGTMEMAVGYNKSEWESISEPTVEASQVSRLPHPRPRPRKSREPTRIHFAGTFRVGTSKPEGGAGSLSLFDWNRSVQMQKDQLTHSIR